MLKAGVHFGHQRSRWHPKMKPYIFGIRNGVHIIDLDKTLEELEKSAAYVKNLAASGKLILFLGTKRQAREIIKEAAKSCGMPYLVERWIGGLITNFDEFKRRLKKYKSLKEMVATGEVEKYTKKERSTIGKQIEKMDKYLSGLTALDHIPDAIYIADVRVEKTALTEARRINVPVVAVCDSNVDPTKVQYPIPGNDDAVNAIRLIANVIAKAVSEGRAEYEKNRVEIKAKEDKLKEERAAAVAVPTIMPSAGGDAEKAPLAPTADQKPVKKIVRRALKKEEAV